MGDHSDYACGVAKMPKHELAEINECRRECGLPELKPEPIMRRCLHCRRSFETTHRTNFMCQNCSYRCGKLKNAW